MNHASGSIYLNDFVGALMSRQPMRTGQFNGQNQQNVSVSTETMCTL